MSKISRALITVLFAGLFLPVTSPVARAANTVVNCGTSGSYTVNESGVVISSTACVGTVTFGSNVTAIGSSTDNLPGVFGNNDSLTVVTIGQTVKSIGKFAFKNGTIESLKFSEGLETISVSAFERVGDGTTINLDVTLPNSLRSIGDSAFESARLGAISMGGNVTYIGLRAFSSLVSNYGAKSFVFRDLNANYPLSSGMLQGYQGQEIILPNTTTTIPSDFAGFSTQKLQFMILPPGTTSFQRTSWDTQQNLKTIVFPNSLTGVPSNAFSPVSLTNVIYCGSDNAILAYSYPNNSHPYCATAVFFRPNGATGNTILETATVGASKALTLNSYTRTGYTFDGWNTKIDGSGTAYSDGQLVTFSSHMVLYAQWWDPSKPRPVADNSAEARRKRQAEIDAARNSLVQKIKAGDTVVNPDLIAADVRQFNAEIAKKANADFQVAAKTKDFGFSDVRTVITKWSIYQDIENGVRSTVTGRTASAAGIIPEGVVQKQLLISRVQKVAPEERATVEQIDKLIADLAKVDAARKAKLAEVTKRISGSSK